MNPRSEIWTRPALVRAIEREHRQLGRRLRALREERKLSQEAAGEAIGIHPESLGRVERGAETVSFATLVAIARAYQVELVAFFKE